MAREPLSRGDLLLLSAVLSAGGAAVAAYLTYEWYTAFASAICNVNSYFSCTAVGNSSYSAIAGVPTSLIGLAGFLILLALSILGFRGVVRIGPWSLDAWIIGFSSLGALIGFGLTLIEIFVINAVCIFCAAGFALDLGVLASGLALRREGARSRAS